MPRLLHVLNGQGTATPFQNSGLPGDLTVWNEALALGPVILEIGTKKFWDLRKNYHSNAYFGLHEELQPNESFEQLVLTHIQKLHESREYQEIILWFEFDLFCQINLIALASWLEDQNLGDVIVSLVCIESFPGITNFKGMGQLGPDDFAQLFPLRRRLTINDLKQAKEIWKCYCDPDPSKINKALVRQKFTAFPYLVHALQKHLQRFPSIKNGLSELESLMLNTVANGSYSQKELVGALLKKDRWYGFGDLYYYLLIQRLTPLLTINNQVEVNATGQAVINGEQDFLDIQTESIPLGGSFNTDFRWDMDKNSLIRNV